MNWPSSVSLIAAISSTDNATVAASVEAMLPSMIDESKAAESKAVEGEGLLSRHSAQLGWVET